MKKEVPNGVGEYVAYKKQKLVAKIQFQHGEIAGLSEDDLLGILIYQICSDQRDPDYDRTVLEALKHARVLLKRR